MKLTANEVKGMNATLNYDNRESQLSDNYSNAGMEELMSELQWSKRQVVGLIGSLTKKGLVSYDKEDDILWLTEKGVNAIFDEIEKES